MTTVRKAVLCKAYSPQHAASCFGRLTRRLLYWASHTPPTTVCVIIRVAQNAIARACCSFAPSPPSLNSCLTLLLTRCPSPATDAQNRPDAAKLCPIVEDYVWVVLIGREVRRPARRTVQFASAHAPVHLLVTFLHFADEGERNAGSARAPLTSDRGVASRTLRAIPLQGLHCRRQLALASRTSG
jgi:hypothetical protein